jgi:hypothetical protein
MPNDLDDNEDLHSSEQANLDETTEAPASGEDAASSTAADATPKDTLSIVRDVVDGAAAEAPDGSGSSPEGEEAEAEVAADKQPDDVDYTDVPFHKHPRFQHLLREKKANEADAVRYRNVEAFLQRSHLDPAEAADGLEIMGLAKTDPVAAWERIKPWAEKIAIAAGVIMPNDLQQRVQNGELTRDAAIEVSRARAQAQSFQTRAQLQRQQAEQRAAQDAQTALVGAATSWETERQTKDPNFGAKLPALQREIAYLHATEGRPDTPAGVRDQCERAYKAVNAAFRPAQPAPQPVKKAVRPVTGGQVAGNPAAKPKSTFDLINRMTGG